MKSVFELYQQYWVSSAILAAANLGVADAVDAEPRDVRDIAAAIGADAEGVHRLLRGLATVGIFRETSPGCFVATELSAQLRDGAPGDARSMIRLFGMKTTRQAMTEYEHAIRTGQSAFGKVHGVENPFELDHGPVDGALYNHAMSSISRGFAKRLARFTFAGVARLVDVGGGTGTLLGHILRRTPAQQGVLFDLPEVVAGARAELEEHGVLERCTIEAGDMRERVPAGGDGYLLKNVLHGWPDDDCVALLRRVREASTPGGRVFVIENVMPEGNDPAPCKTFDLFLLLGGARSKVRSRAQFAQLFERAGLALVEVTPIIANDCVVEARALP